MITWLRVEPFEPTAEARKDLQTVYTTSEETVVWHQRTKDLYRTRGGFWFKAVVVEVD